MKLNPEWAQQPLADVVDILDSQRVPVKAIDRAARGGDVPYYGATGQAGTIDRALFNEPLVLLGEDGAPFFDPAKPKAYLVDGPAWVNNHAHVLRAKPALDRRFLKYYLDVFDYRGYANGTTRLKLTQGSMRKIAVPVPDFREQRRIVEILEEHLSHLDAADRDIVSAADKKLSLWSCHLAEMARGPSRTLASLALTTGYGTSEKCVANGPGPAVVRIPNIVQGRVDLRNEKRVADADASVRKSMLSPGDLLLVRTNGSVDLIGRSAVVQAGIDAAFASYLIRYRFDSSIVRPEWVHAMLSSPSARRAIESLAASSAGQYNLSLGKLNPFEIPVPSIEVQDTLLRRLAGLSDDLSTLTNALEQASARSKNLRRAVLAASFEGKLTGRYTDSEVIEELAEA